MLATLLCLCVSLPLAAASEDSDHHQQAAATDLDKLLDQSRKSLDDGDVPGAFKSLEEARKLAPADSRIAYLTGLSYLRQAELAIEQNRGGGQADSALTDAESNLRQAAELSPASAAIARTLGHCLMLQGKEEDAAKSLESAQSLGAREPEFCLELGDAHFGIYVKQKDAAEGDLGAAELALAEQAYQNGRAQVVVASLANITAESLAGNSDLPNTIHQQVIDAITRSDASGTYSALCRKIGFARWYAKDAKAAFDAFLEGLKVAPADAGAHQDLYSFVNQESSHLDDTIAFYNTLASEDPLRFWFLGQLEVSRGNKGLNYRNPRDATLHYFAAMAAFETSVAVEPSYEADVKTWLALCHSYAGYALTDAKAYAPAEHHFLQAHQINPELDVVDGLDKLGAKMYAASEKSEIKLGQVRDYFARITEVVADHADWWNNLGLFARDTEKYDQSYAAYDKAVALQPDNARFLNDRALILFYHLNRDLDKAEGDFQKAIALGRKEFADSKDEVKKDDAFTAFTDAMVNLARLYHKQSRTAECRATIEDLLHEQPGRQEGIELRAQIEDECAAAKKSE